VSVPTAHHVGVTVTDLDRATEFYVETFDLTPTAEFTVGGTAFADAVAVEDAEAAFVHLAAGDIVIELVAYDPEADSMPVPELNRPGVAHIGLTVDDVDSFYATLDPEVETLSPPQTTESGTTVCFVRDPAGNLIEVLDA